MWHISHVVGEDVESAVQGIAHGSCCGSRILMPPQIQPPQHFPQALHELQLLGHGPFARQNMSLCSSRSPDVVKTPRMEARSPHAFSSGLPWLTPYRRIVVVAAVVVIDWSSRGRLHHRHHNCQLPAPAHSADIRLRQRNPPQGHRPPRGSGMLRDGTVCVLEQDGGWSIPHGEWWEEGDTGLMTLCFTAGGQCYNVPRTETSACATHMQPAHPQGFLFAPPNQA